MASIQAGLHLAMKWAVTRHDIHRAEGLRHKAINERNGWDEMGVECLFIGHHRNNYGERMSDLAVSSPAGRLARFWVTPLLLLLWHRHTQCMMLLYLADWQTASQTFR